MDTKNQEFEKIYQKALRFLSFRPRSEKEVRNYLIRKTKKIKDVQLLIKELKRENLINDSEFADWWIKQRLDYNHKGPKIIKIELLGKGLDKELVEDKISSVTNKKIEKSALFNIRIKSGKYLNLQKRVQKVKLIKLLLAKGFEYEVSKRLVDEWSERG